MRASSDASPSASPSALPLHRDQSSGRAGRGGTLSPRPGACGEGDASYSRCGAFLVECRWLQMTAYALRVVVVSVLELVLCERTVLANGAASLALWVQLLVAATLSQTAPAL